MTPERTLIGVDIGGTKIVAALMRGRLPAPGARTPAEVETPEIVDRFTTLTDVSSAEACMRAVEDCIGDLEHGSGRVEGIGVGVASMVDFAGGRIVESVNLPLSDVPLRDHLQRRFGVPVVVDNDATAAAIGEHVFGAGVGTQRHAHAHARHRRRGRHHQRRPPHPRRQRRRRGDRPHHHRRQRARVSRELPQPRLPRGVRGRTGHGGRRARGGRARARLGPGARAGRRQRPSTAGCSPAWRSRATPARSPSLERAGEYLGAGLVTLSNIFDPEVIVIGGGAAAAGELLFAPARRVLAARALPPARDRVRVVPAALGPDAGFVGAAALALTELFPGDAPA